MSAGRRLIIKASVIVGTLSIVLIAAASHLIWSAHPEASGSRSPSVRGQLRATLKGTGELLVWSPDGQTLATNSTALCENWLLLGG